MIARSKERHRATFQTLKDKPVVEVQRSDNDCFKLIIQPLTVHRSFDSYKKFFSHPQTTIRYSVQNHLCTIDK